MIPCLPSLGACSAPWHLLLTFTFLLCAGKGVDLSGDVQRLASSRVHIAEGGHVDAWELQLQLYYPVLLDGSMILLLPSEGVLAVVHLQQRAHLDSFPVASYSCLEAQQQA